jgi:hypothetical protein
VALLKNDVDSSNAATYSRGEVDLLLKRQAEQLTSELTQKKDNTFKTALVALIMSIVGLVVIYIKS